MRIAVTAHDALTVNLGGKIFPARWISREDENEFRVRVSLFASPAVLRLRFIDEGISWCRGVGLMEVMALRAAGALACGLVAAVTAPFTWAP